MSITLSRRSVLSGGAAALSLAAFGSGPAWAQAARLRFLWWGSQERADRTFKAIEAYKGVASDVSITGEFAGWSDYWPRLATQVAGRNAPDLIQMDYRYIFEYARRGALLPPYDTAATREGHLVNDDLQNIAGLWLIVRHWMSFSLTISGPEGMQPFGVACPPRDSL